MTGCPQSTSRLWMPNQLAVGAAGGSFSTLVLGLVRQVLLEDRGSPFPLPDCLCPTGDLNLEVLEDPKVRIFLCGLGIGIALGPCLDLLWLLRERWRRFIASLVSAGGAQAPSTRALYKVVHE